jgi:glycosyltransferase 2 family protein
VSRQGTSSLRIRRIIRLAIQWLIPTGILAAFVLTGHFSAAISALRDVSLVWSIPLVVIGVGLPISHAWRWCFLLQRIGEQLSLPASVRITSLASLINYAAPGFLGAPAKAILARDSHRIPIGKSLPTLAIEQVLDAFFLVVASGLAIFLAGPTIVDAGRQRVTVENTVVLLAVLAFLIAAALLAWIIGKRLLPAFARSLQSATLELIRSPEFRKPIAAFTATRWVLDMAAVGVASIAVGLRLSLVEILLVANLSLLIGLLAPVPGGLGVREAVMATVAGVIGVSIPAILALSVLHRAGLAAGLPIALAGARVREWSAR